MLLLQVYNLLLWKTQVLNKNVQQFISDSKISFLLFVLNAKEAINFKTLINKA